MEIKECCTTAMNHLFLPEILMRENAVDDLFIEYTEDILNGKYAPRPKQDAGKFYSASMPPENPAEALREEKKRYFEMLDDDATVSDFVIFNRWLHREHLPEDIKERNYVEEHPHETIEVDGERITVDVEGLRHSLPPASFPFGEILGPDNNPWKFWFKLNDSERRLTYNYTPIYITVDRYLDFDTSMGIGMVYSGDQEPESIEHLEQSLNVIYYPFGLFSIRLKTNFRVAEPISPERLIQLRRSFIHNTGLVTESDLDAHRLETPRALFSLVRREILNTVFVSDIPSNHEIEEPDLDFHHLTYLYDADEIDEESMAKIVADETRPLSSEFINYKTKNRLGMIKDDYISMSASGGVLYTPHYDTVNQNNRRKSRISLLNNAYLASDFGMFDKKYLPEIGIELRDIQKQAVDGTRIGLPMDGEGVAALLDVLDLPENFRGTRYQMYRDVTSLEQKKKHRKRIENLIPILSQHESGLREAVKSLPLGSLL
jgi:hypothetical protein